MLGTDAIVVLDIPLLVRADGTSDKDRYANLSGIVVVDVDTEIAVERLVEFRGFSRMTREREWPTRPVARTGVPSPMS